VVAGFYLQVFVVLGYGNGKKNKKRNIPAATLAFLTKSAKARGHCFNSSAHNTPGPNQPLELMMDIISSCTTDKRVVLNDNQNKSMSHGTRIRWTSVVCVLLAKYWKLSNSKSVLIIWIFTK
jgi:hypothetical protein